jgi:hypothetical protein
MAGTTAGLVPVENDPERTRRHGHWLCLWNSMRPLDLHMQVPTDESYIIHSRMSGD